MFWSDVSSGKLNGWCTSGGERFVQAVWWGNLRGRDGLDDLGVGCKTGGGYVVARLVAALRYKPEGSIPDGVTGIFQ